MHASKDERVTQPLPADKGKWLGLALIALGVAMIIVDATIVNVAIPSIIRDLRIPFTTAEWINTIYALVFASLLIAVGRVADIFGRKRLFLTGLVIFVGASMLAGLAPSGGWLLAARFLQGIGGAIILPSTLSTLNATFQGRERAIAFGVWGSVIGGMAALGPLLGGWLTTDFSWRWAFYINVPIGLIAFLGSLRYVVETRDENAELVFDIPGTIAVTIGLAALVFGLIEGETYGWLRPKREFTVGPWTWPFQSVSVIVFAFALAAVCLVSFALMERARAHAGRTVLLDFRLFRLRGFAYGNLAALIVSLGEFGLIFVIPLFLQAVLGYSAFRTGVVLISLAAGAFVAGPSAAQLSSRIGARRVVSLGMALEAVGVLFVARILTPDVTGLELAPFLFVYGMGVGFATAQLTSVILADVPTEQSGQASGTQSTVRQVGSALGIAILGTLLTVGLASGTRTRLADAPRLSPQAVDLIVQVTSSSAGTGLRALCSTPASAGSPVCRPAVLSAIQAKVDYAFVESTRRVALVGAGFILVGLVASLLLPRAARVDTTRA